MVIKAIFYSRFLSNRGTSVLHQVPDGAIVPGSSESSVSPLFDFDAIASYLTPPPAFSDRLTTLCISHYRLLGYPVRIESSRYHRNAFQFNFCIVLEESTDASSYKPVVKKLARLFRAVEKQSSFLSRDEQGLIEDPQGGIRWTGRVGQVYTLIEALMEDLNNYSECMIPIDTFNTINVKLFPLYPNPPPVKPFHVPIATVNLDKLIDTNWDLTMLKVLPYIDGLNTVRRISELAETSYDLTRKCIQHLLYYSCLILVDVFQFSNIYAPTPLLSTFVSSTEMQNECAGYVCTLPGTTPSTAELCALFASLRQGLSVKNWAIANAARLSSIDIRRFIMFGVVKGLIYRVHKWCYRAPLVPTTDGAVQTMVREEAPRQRVSITEKEAQTTLPLVRFLDGRHCFDEISSELQSSEKEVLNKLRAYGEVQIIHR